jgi:hypothetical protein
VIPSVQNGAESVLVDTAEGRPHPNGTLQKSSTYCRDVRHYDKQPHAQAPEWPQQRFYLRNCLIVKNNVICSFFHQTDINSVKHR